MLLILYFSQSQKARTSWTNSSSTSRFPSEISSLIQNSSSNDTLKDIPERKKWLRRKRGKSIATKVINDSAQEPSSEATDNYVTGCEVGDSMSISNISDENTLAPGSQGLRRTKRNKKEESKMGAGLKNYSGEEDNLPEGDNGLSVSKTLRAEAGHSISDINDSNDQTLVVKLNRLQRKSTARHKG